MKCVSYLLLASSVFVTTINSMDREINAMRLVTVRTPQVTDLGQVKELMRVVWFDTYTKFYSKEVVEKVTEAQTVGYLRYQLESDDHIFLVAKTRANEVVGVITAAYESPELVKLTRLYVHPHWRSAGIGALLLRLTLGICKDALAMNIPVKEKNERAIAFYQRFGFKPVAKEDQTFFGETAVNVILQKQLQQARL